MPLPPLPSMHNLVPAVDPHLQDGDFFCKILCVSDATLNCTLSSVDPRFFMEMAGGAPLPKYRHLASITANCIDVNVTLTDPVLTCYKDQAWKRQGYLCALFREKEEAPDLYLEFCQTVYDILTHEKIILFYIFLLLMVLIYFCWDFYRNSKYNTRPFYKRLGMLAKKRRGQEKTHPQSSLYAPQWGAGEDSHCC